ncbi:MAG: hypothetical protein ACR2PO_04750 [Methyloligellaceae bacterium]
MELPLYAYCPETTIGRRQKRPLAERLLDWMTHWLGGVSDGTAVPHGL